MTSTIRDGLKPLIESKRWDAVVERLTTEIVISEPLGTLGHEIGICLLDALEHEDLPLYVLDAFLKVCPDQYFGTYSFHHAIYNNLSGKIVGRLIEKNPEGVRTRQKSSFRPLPIHVAASVASVEVVNRLIDAYPDGVREKDRDWRFPIHYAAEKCKSLEVVNRLIEAYPEGLKKGDKISLHLPIHFAARSSKSVEVIMRLIEAYPEGLWLSSCGDLPIHYAAQKNSADIIKALICSDPLGVQARADCKHVSIGYHSQRWMRCTAQFEGNISAMEASVDPDPWGVPRGAYIMGPLPIHYAAQSQDDVSVLKALIDSYPLSILLTSRYDDCALLPSEHAIVNNNSAEVISFLENEEKRAIVELAHVVVGRQRKMEKTNKG